jgi:ABC-2 type transport system permease protein
MNLTAFIALVRNDIRLYLKEPRALIVGVLVPILIAAFFGYVFNDSNGSDTGRIAVAVVNQDDSPLSAEIARRLAASPMLEIKPATEDEARRLVGAGKLRVALILPAGFGANAATAFYGQSATMAVPVLFDPSQRVTRDVVEGLFTQQVLAATAQAVHAGIRVPFEFAPQPLTSGGNVPYNSYAHSFAGMTVQFTLFGGIDAGVALLLLRERGLWKRLRAAPLRRAVLVGAKIAATTLTGLFAFLLVYAAAMLVFGVRIQGSVAGFVCLVSAFCLANACFGLLLAAIGRTPSATRGLASMCVLLLVMLGGAWVPSFVFPKWLQQVALAAPTRWAVDGLDAVTWRGLGFESAVGPVLVLLATAATCFVLAIWRFRWDDR